MAIMDWCMRGELPFSQVSNFAFECLARKSEMREGDELDVEELIIETILEFLWFRDFLPDGVNIVFNSASNRGFVVAFGKVSEDEDQLLLSIQRERGVNAMRRRIEDYWAPVT